MSARIGIESLLGSGAAMLEPNISARIGVKSLFEGSWRHFEATDLVSQDWGKVVVRSCWRHFEVCQPGLG